MAILTDLPFELLSIVAADSCLTNRDRKQARLACKQLAAVTTPVIFKRAYLSRFTADRDAFLSLAATPYLAAHVEEVIWFELEVDWRSSQTRNQFVIQLFDGRKVNLLTAARDLFWLPVESRLMQNRHDRIIHRKPPACATEFLVQFKAAVARMPKLRTFASEQMAPRRLVSLADGFPFEVGLLMKFEVGTRVGAGLLANHQTDIQGIMCSDFLHIFLDTIVEERGRIANLRCGHEMSMSLGRIDPRHHAALPYLRSLEISTSHLSPPFYGDKTAWNLGAAIYKATELRELSVAMDYISEFLRWPRPIPCFNALLVRPAPSKFERWKHLQSLKLGAIDVQRHMRSFLSLIKAHVPTLRHLHLDQCCPNMSLALELSKLDGLQLDSITISDSEIPKSGLITEEDLLRFIRGESFVRTSVAKKIRNGKFVTHNRRVDNIDDHAFEDSESDPDDPDDHSSEWWSDTDSESEPDTAPTGQDRVEASG